MTVDAPEGVLGEIERRCGRDAAMRLAARFGGQRLYVPKRAGLSLVMVGVVCGEPVARALVDAFGGEKVVIPLLGRQEVERRKATIHELHAEGRAVDEIAAATRLSRRYVQIVLRGRV